MRDSARTQGSIHFSARSNWNTAETAWSLMLAARRKQGLPVFDLTAANPTQCGFRYDEQLLNVLQQADARRYEPLPFGLLNARQAVCNYYRDHVAALPVETLLELSVEQILLTTSTSEAYSYLFRLLCDPGDEVLIAQPSYPLFDFLAGLDDVKLTPYPLFYDYGWHLDLDAVRKSVSPRTRAVIVVHPNNPTGHFTTEFDRRALEAICAECGLALIVDEVFLDYSLQEKHPSFTTGGHPALTFVLSGLSKIAGLPQMKLSWIAAFGGGEELERSLARLDVIADTFLSLSTPLQLALPAWLQSRKPIQDQIQKRVTGNLKTLDALMVQAVSVDRLQVEGGWYAIVRAPAVRSGEEAALRLLEDGVAVHTGDFFGMPGDGHFVISLLPEQEVFRNGAATMMKLLSVNT